MAVVSGGAENSATTRPYSQADGPGSPSRAKKGGADATPATTQSSSARHALGSSGAGKLAGADTSARCNVVSNDSPFCRVDRGGGIRSASLPALALSDCLGQPRPARGQLETFHLGGDP